MGDFVLLPKVDMDSFLANLKARHAAGLIYTYIGEVCVSVNPYKSLDIYGTNFVNHYKVCTTFFMFLRGIYTGIIMG